MKPAVPIVFSTDDPFAPYCAVSIASLTANCDPARQYRIYILFDTLTRENQEKLGGMGRDNVTVELVQISRYVDRDLLYAHSIWSVAAYFRLLIVDVLPQCDKILYLDSDIAVLGDVGELYDIDLGSCLLGAVTDPLSKNQEKRKKYSEHLETVLNVSPEKYINSGILSMNLRQFRAEDTKKSCVAFLQEHRELLWPDQDTLNAVCKGRIHYLPEIWNKGQGDLEEELQENGSVGDVKIIHYLGTRKPWLVPFRRTHLFFYQYALLTPYRDTITAELLENHEPTKRERKRAIKKVEKLAAKGSLDFRFLLRCAALWTAGKIKRQIRRTSQ